MFGIPGQQQPAQPAAKPRRADPFGAPAAGAPQAREVKLVIDDSAVSDSDVGRKSRSRNFILVGLGAVLGVALGFGVGSTSKDRQVFKQVVQDGKDLYGDVQNASGTVEEAKKLAKRALEAATPSPGKEVKVDYDSITSLQGLAKPIDASTFYRRWYKAFQPGTVDELFEYNSNIQTIWTKIASLAAGTLPDGKRKLLDESAKAGDTFAKYQYGLVPASQNDQFYGALAYLTIPEQPAEPAKGAKAPAGMVVEVAQRPGGRTVEKLLYQGQPDLGANPDKYVVMVDKGRSAGILAEGASTFAQYRADLNELSGLLDKTVEIQGRLLTELGKVAALQ